mmetsp:Transcript_31744/g.86033  ORF Transcript_31744/g.86033 Transcript_31744/m.86033 type:complete len:419 (-) Transcript_31744:18-1274(-)
MRPGARHAIAKWNGGVPEAHEEQAHAAIERQGGRGNIPRQVPVDVQHGNHHLEDHSAASRALHVEVQVHNQHIRGQAVQQTPDRVLVEELVDRGTQDLVESHAMQLVGDAERDRLPKEPADHPCDKADREPKHVRHHVGPAINVRVLHQVIRPSSEDKVAHQVQVNSHAEGRAGADEVSPAADADNLLEHVPRWPALELLLAQPRLRLALHAGPSTRGGNGDRLGSLLVPSPIRSMAAQQPLVRRCFHHLVRCSLLCDRAGLHHHDVVESAEALRIWLQTDQPCTPLHQRPQEELFKQYLCSWSINRREGVIDNYQLGGAVVGCPCHGNARLLPSGKRDSAAAYARRVPAQDRQVGLQRCSFECFLVPLCVVGLAKKHVILYRALDNVWDLRAVSDHLRPADERPAAGIGMQLAQHRL